MLDHIVQLGENKDLSLKQLSLKVGDAYMSLTSASRVSELQALDLRFCQYTVNEVVFKLASLGQNTFERGFLC